jgi:iron-sulfur cluster repair protein YtfE (RIC family)
MPIQIGQKQEADFSNPLGLLSDCHRRIEYFLEILVRVCGRTGVGSLQADERTALEKALAYFRNSAPKHTADEEDSLFPRLRGSEDGQSALECLASLEGDHEVAARDHEIVDAFGRQWLDQGSLGADQLAEMQQTLDRLSRAYQRHIAIEDTELFPLAARALAPSQLAEVGREMAERRGVPAPVTRKA